MYGDAYRFEVLFVREFRPVIPDDCAKEAEEATQVVGVAQPGLYLSLNPERELNADEGLRQASELHG